MIPIVKNEQKRIAQRSGGRKTMICKYCYTEHPEDQVANPHYCISRLQEDLEKAETALKFAHMEKNCAYAETALEFKFDQIVDEKAEAMAAIARLRKPPGDSHPKTGNSRTGGRDPSCRKEDSDGRSKETA